MTPRLLSSTGLLFGTLAASWFTVGCGSGDNFNEGSGAAAGAGSAAGAGQVASGGALSGAAGMEPGTSGAGSGAGGLGAGGGSGASFAAPPALLRPLLAAQRAFRTAVAQPRAVARAATPAAPVAAMPVAAMPVAPARATWPRTPIT